MPALEKPSVRSVPAGAQAAELQLNSVCSLEAERAE